MTGISLPPHCPVCGGNTTLKEMHRSSRDGEFTCFFRCVSCGTDYPRSVEIADAQQAGLRPAGEPEPAL